MNPLNNAHPQFPPQAIPTTPWRAKPVRVLGSLLVLLAAAWFTPAASAATSTTCGAATAQGTTGPADYATYCWIDFSGFNNTTASSAAGQAFVVTLPGGSTLSFTLKLTGGALGGVAAPTWTGAAFGQSAFLNVPNKPALYQTTNGTTSNVSLNNIVLTVGSGTVPYAIVAADAESTNNGESLSFTTNGNAWTQLAAMAYNGTTPTFPTVSGVGTTTVTETGVAGNVGAYAFATQGSPTTISSVVVGGGLQGIAFAVKFHAVDFAIASSHTGNFKLGGTGSYTLNVTSNGPDTYSPADTITVTDTLPAGLTYTSASGTGWTCGDVGQVVTCTVSNVTISSGGTLPAITVNVSVGYTTAASVTNTATVASNPSLDFNLANNTSNDVTTLVDPDLSTSTKAVINTNGGDYDVGDTVQYTITLTESAGVAAINASVTDDIPNNLSNFTVVSIPGGATDSSTGAGTGANNAGFLNITGIAVPANGSVTVVFTAQVAAGTANCQTVPNTATVTNPFGPGATPSSPTFTVAQSLCASSGNKVLYTVDSSKVLTRTPPVAYGAGVNIAGANGTATWTLSPVLAGPLVLPAQTVQVVLIVKNTGNSTGSNRALTVRLLNGAASLGVSGGCTTCTSATAAAITFQVTIPATTIAAGGTLDMVVTNPIGTANRTVSIYQLNATTGATTPSTVTLDTTTVINVDDVTAFNAVYPATTTNTIYTPGTTVFVCAVISDPFGSYDIDPATIGATPFGPYSGTAPQITLTDPNGVVQLSATAMTKETTPNGGLNNSTCSNDTSTADLAFEYSYAIPANAALGFWTASVKGFEGTEGAVTHTANGAFLVNLPPTVTKLVGIVSDPVEGTTRPKSIPGAVVQYTLLVQNNGATMSNGSLVITDLVPANTAFNLTGATPFTFTDGSPTSGLSAPVMTFSNNNGLSYAYTPTCNRPCTDTAINGIKVTFTGAMNGKTGATAPSFTLTFTVVLQ